MSRLLGIVETLLQIVGLVLIVLDFHKVRRAGEALDLRPLGGAAGIAASGSGALHVDATLGTDDLSAEARLDRLEGDVEQLREQIADQDAAGQTGGS